ncbi:phosphoribosylanthranilate isomerase [Clostridium sartagoforme]|uniref:N-(5'-phosphoribosyl)anthranilate isomerase n=1 Tax=Clostridium sartagoforme TaxID=84031 RepID=A0A4S2DGP7_9CLOT|nr:MULTISPECIES: phosphoribosylanthranilate isomerase [Clostridium]MBS5938709.1 phosphoribosylanthranilate isomerase [Clostridium sp.]TGY40935.1 phosphoribosylanthranilate isomerase [Clostridium sartagoforme]
MEIKICGITKLQEIKYSNKLRPDYIGFVFSESKRKISKEEARELLANLNNEINSVGVFRNEKVDFISEVLNYTNIKIVQLHGSEDNEYIEALKNKVRNKIEVWKAISIIDEKSIKEINSFKAENILLDSGTPGEGKRFKLKVLGNFKEFNRVFMAGGINEDNIQEVIETLNPKGIDVSSGAEIINENGVRIKSYEKMKKIIGEVRKNDKRKI